MYLIALGTGLNGIFKHAGFGNYIVFLSPGIIAMAVMTSAFVSGISVLWDRKFGQLKSILVTPAPRYALVIGRCLGAASAAAVQGVLILVLVAFMTMTVPAPSSIVPTIVLTIATGILFSAMGITFGSLIKDFQTVQLVVNFIIMPMFFLSGALFPIASIVDQKLLVILIRVNPAAYCVDGLRIAMGQAGHFTAIADAIGIGASLLLSIGCASIAMSRAQVD